MDYDQDLSLKWLKPPYNRNIADCYEKESESRLMRYMRYRTGEDHKAVLDKIMAHLSQNICEDESCSIILPEAHHVEYPYNDVGAWTRRARAFPYASTVHNKSSTSMPMPAIHVKASEDAGEPTAHVLENLARDCRLPLKYASKIRTALEDASRFISDRGVKCSILHELFTDPEFPDWKMIKVTFKTDVESSHIHDELKDQIYEIISSTLDDHILENIIIKFDSP